MTRAPLETSPSTAGRWLAIAADVALLLAGLFVLYTLLGGELHWKSSLFRITLTEPNRPVQICLLILLVKAVFGLTEGLFASLARTGPPGVGTLAAGVHALDRRLHAVFVAYRAPLLLSAASLVVSLGFLELYLRNFPLTLPTALANHLASGYHTGPSGIYRYAPELQTRLMHPNHERTMYFNTYRWRHKTDSRGFRNPVDRTNATVVLLGDSMVYGHGVEETSTIRHHLEVMLGQPVVNLGVQGSSIHDEYQVLKTFGVGLRPRYVFLFFLGNDIDDLGGLTDDEKSAFLATSPADHSTPYFETRVPRKRRWDIEWSRALEAHVDDLYVMKAVDYVRRHVRARWGRRAEAAQEDPRARSLVPAPRESTLAMRFHLHALRKIQDLADRNGFQFVNVFTYTGYMPNESVYEQILEAFGRLHGITFLSLRPAFKTAVGNGQEVFLRGDGHFSDGGARLAAQVLARFVDAHPAPRVRP
jgi:hypothetical protein